MGKDSPGDSAAPGEEENLFISIWGRRVKLDSFLLNARFNFRAVAEEQTSSASS